MNVLANSLKSLSTRVCSFAKQESYAVRNYAFKSDLKIKWVRPEKIPCIKPEVSGDLGLNLKVSPKDLARTYDKSVELHNSNDLVKKLFTLEYLPAKHTTEMRRDAILARVQRHKCDRRSIEAKIAVMTNRIEQMQNQMELNPRNTKMRVNLKELIDRRKKFLGYLRNWDYKRFEWILEQLNLVYKPHPSTYHHPTRKESLVKLTDKHCQKLIDTKLEAYRKELEAQQKLFYKEKAEKLAFIRSEELEFGLKPTVSEEEIQQAKEKYESLK